MDMQIQREIEASAAQVWAVLGEGFGELDWSRSIESSSLQGELGVGAVRTCTFPANAIAKAGSVRERLVEFDPDARRLSYEAREIGLLERAVNRWSITPLGPRRCRVQSHATVKLRGLAVLLTPLMRMMIRRMGHQFLDDLVAHLATARPEATARPAA